MKKNFEQQIDAIVAETQQLLSDPQRAAQAAMPGQAYFLSQNKILALPRDNGYSRYPYGQNGFNFWVYASGYMHSNEGLFSHFLRAAEGQEPNIAFFMGLPKDNGRFSVVPLMPVPQSCYEADHEKTTRFTVFSTSAAYFITQTDGLQTALRVLVTPDRAVCFSLEARNLTDKPRSFFLSSYLNPFLRHQIFETGEDRWFKEVRVLPPGPKQGELGSFLVQVNEDKDRLTSVSYYGVVRRGLTLDAGSKLTAHEETASRYQYVGGTRGSLHTASPLAAGTFGKPRHVCAFTETGIAGDILKLELAPSSRARLDIAFTHTDDAALAQQQAQQPIVLDKIEDDLDQLDQADTSRHIPLTASVGPATGSIKTDVFNPFFEHLKRQVEFCSLIKGYIQLSPNSLIGIRDVFQALEGLAFWRPDATRAKMLEALGYTAPDGRCFRQYSLPSAAGQVGRMDLRQFIDQGVWVISTITTYIRVTGDWAFLDEACGYYEIVDEERGQVNPSDKQGSVLEHMIKIMDYMLSKRDHDLTGCLRAMYGDWNDALDGLGVSQDPARPYGSGVSVMATLQLYQNCQEMIELLSGQDKLKAKYPARISQYRDDAKELEQGLKKYAIVQDSQGEKRIVHGWGDKRSYLVGGFKDPDGKARDGLTSNAFWVLSGLHGKDTAMGRTILDAFGRLDSKYGLKTFEPYFAEDAPGVGRIRKLPGGTAENAAPYVHATTFAVMALFQMGRAEEAWQQLEKILPFTDIHENLSHSPFVMPNAYGYNPEKFIDGQNMNDWQTGSSNVVLKTLIRYVFGFEPTLDGLWVQPAAWLPFESFKFQARYRGCDVEITLQNKGKGKRSFIVDGQPHEATPDPLLGTDKLWIANGSLGQDTLRVSVTQ